MAIEDRKMIKYTDNELKALTDELIDIDFETTDLRGNLVTHVTMDGNRVAVDVDDLTSVILRKTPKSIPINLLKLYTVIHRIDLEQIPLYLNSFPEVVAWRLRIGK